MTTTDLDTGLPLPEHTTGETRLKMTVALENMPAIKTHYGPTSLMATQAVVTFDISAEGTVTWKRIELTGVMPTKAGLPSKRSNSDAWSSHWSAARAGEPDDDMPREYMDVVFTARHQLDRMMAGLLK